MLRFISETANGMYQRILIAETGEDITKKLALSYGAQVTLGMQITAKIELCMLQLDVVAARTIWGTKHPLTGEYIAIRALEFVDGTRLEFTEDGTPVFPSTPEQATLDVINSGTGQHNGTDLAATKKSTAEKDLA